MNPNSLIKSLIRKLISALDCSARAAAPRQKPGRYQAKLLTWILLFALLFSMAALCAMLIFNPHHDPQLKQYALLISGLAAFFAIAYGLNCAGHYNTSALLFVACAALTPWASLLLDPSILRGDFVPLAYLTFSVLLSSILLPIYVTLALAALQFAGVALVLIISPAAATFNWFSFLAFIFLTSAFSILSNGIIQRNVKQIDDQARQLALSEARLREQSVRDYLTNLFNRRYLEETLEREIQRATRKQVSLGVIMLDVDHFKRINDSLGHAAGDAVLRELGKFLAGEIRQSDIACRYGGDEFALVLPEASRETTKERAEHLRDGAKSLDLPVAVVISLGVAVFPDDGATSDAVLHAADVALYQDKRNGNNSAVPAI